MRVALFLTCDRAAVPALVQRQRTCWPGAWFCAFVNDDDLKALQGALAGCEVRRDKPDGGRLAFLRALRGERFDLLVVAWHGGGRFHPLRLAALFAGARKVLAVDERGRERHVRWWQPWTWAGHALRRAAGTKAAAVARAAAWLYRGTVGLLIACLALLWFALVRGVLPRRRAAGDDAPTSRRHRPPPAAPAGAGSPPAASPSP